jgi:hypothetical protein
MHCPRPFPSPLPLTSCSSRARICSWAGASPAERVGFIQAPQEGCSEQAEAVETAAKERGGRSSAAWPGGVSCTPARGSSHGRSTQGHVQDLSATMPICTATVVVHEGSEEKRVAAQNDIAIRNQHKRRWKSVLNVSVSERQLTPAQDLRYALVTCTT